MDVCGQRNRLAVIATRGGNHAVVCALLREMAHEIQSAANLECAGHLMVFVLEEDAGADLSCEQRIFDQRRRFHRAINDLARGADVFN